LTRIKFHGRTDPGRKRPINEDSFVASDDDAFCVLCDGMGGHSSGEVASRMAVEILASRIRGARELIRGSKEVLPAVVQSWLHAANDAIYRRGTQEPGVVAGRNMGTTLALLCFVDEVGVVAHVGDSRIYRLRDGVLDRLTLDHSVTGPYTGTDPAGRGRKRKYVTRALGTRPEVDPDVGVVDVRTGDRYVVCSDGLTDLVDDDEIAAALHERERELHNAPRALINLANERGGRDTITVIVAEVVPAPTPTDDHVPGEDSTAALIAPPPLDPPPPWESSDSLEGPV
jgi:serine/threonine protein phosphatase PrpC